MEEDLRPSGERRALWASTALIAAVVLLQAPGRIIPETKLDVSLDAADYLGRALSAWDPSAAFGRVQNQAIGYLFPMGAFSAAGQAVGLPPWFVQRLWIALVVSVGLWGAHRVARALGVGSAGGRLAAGWAYALAPATLSVAAFQSAGQVPYALAPWVLVPLLEARDGDGPRRVAARSTLAIAAMGGVNGASAFAVLPLVAVWFATRSPGPARRRLFGWWCAGAAAATLWWLIPLLVSVRYGVRFTDYTEPAALTTLTESATEVLRGTGNWLAFLHTEGGLWLPGGWALTAHRVAIVGSVAVAAGGLAGLARRDAPGRSWLVPSLALGAVLLGIGYAGAGSGPFAQAARDLLDGPLAPFRNVHKFSAVVRLPIALGLGHLVAVAARSASARSGTRTDDAAPTRRRIPPALATALAGLVVVLSVAPASVGKLPASGSFEDVPDAWRQAAAWLDERDGGQRSLLLPGSAFAEYRWGRPLDEPIGALDAGDWAVRDLIPLGGLGSTRLLDGIDAALQDEALPPGFASTLARSGVRFLVVRNDLDLVRTGGPRPATVRRLLAEVDGLRLVASFGPAATDPGRDGRLSVPPGQAAAEVFRDLDVYEVDGAVGPVASYPLAGAAVVSGGPEALLDLPPSITDGRATVLAVDEGADAVSDPLRIATDTARRRDVRYGSIRGNASYTLTADEPSPLTGEAPVDRWPAGEPIGLTEARVDGAATIADSREPGQPMLPEQQPFAAFDDNPTTAWAPSQATPVGEWVEVTFDEPVDVAEVTVVASSQLGRRVRSVRVTTDAGDRAGAIGSDGSVTVPTAGGPTRRIRVAIASVDGVAVTAPVGLAEIELDGVVVRRPLVLPSPGGDGADVASLARSGQDVLAPRRRDEDGLLDREVRLGTGGPVVVSGTAAVVPGAELDALLATVTPTSPDDLEATGSSHVADHPAFGPPAAADGDPTSAWISADEPGAPQLALRWDGAVPIDSIRIDVLEEAGLDAVGEVEVLVGGQQVRRGLDASGRISVPATTTEEVVLRFPGATGDAAGTRQVAIAEVELSGLLGRESAVPDPEASLDLGCGSGPALAVDGAAVATRARATVAELLSGIPVPWEACEPVELAAGTHRVTAEAGALVASRALIVPADGVEPVADARRIDVESWGREVRSVAIAAGPAALLATTENANDGWEARLDGDVLAPIQVDGWRQGWLVPEGEGGTIELRYAPGRAHRWGLVGGFVALAGLVAAALVPFRRQASGGALLDRRVGRAWAPVLTLTVGVALAGPIALLGLPLLLVPALQRRLPLVAGGAALGAGVVAFAAGGAGAASDVGTFSAPAQALATLALMAVAASIAGAGGAEPSTVPAAGDAPGS